MNDDFPSSVTEVLICAAILGAFAARYGLLITSCVTEVLICAAILGLSSVLAAFLFFALIS